MPTPEIINSPIVPVVDVPEQTVAPTQHEKHASGNYIRSIVLLIAVYALIINRSHENKRAEQEKIPATEQSPNYTNAYVHTSKKDKQQTLPAMFYIGLSIAFYPSYMFLK